MGPSRSFIVTGGNAGLGLSCAAFLVAGRSGTVVIACRDIRKGEQAAIALRQAGGTVEVLPLDLAVQASVRNFSDMFRKRGLPPLAGLICNAGLQNIGPPAKSADGFEMTFAVNHLGHYLLSRLLLDDLTPASRIIFVSSGTHDPAKKTGLPAPRYVNAKAVANDFEAGAEAGRRRYTASKLCNIYCAYEFARKLAASSDPKLRSIRVNAFDPGLMPGTGLARTYPAALQFAWNYILPVATLFRRNVNRPATSGRRLAKLATGPEGDVSGKYFSDGRQTSSSEFSYDEANATDLWNASAE